MRLVIIVLVFLIGKVPSPPVETIEVQPYIGISEKYTKGVVEELLKVHPKVVVNKAIVLPRWCKVNGRYRSDSLLKHLESIVQKGHVIVGITISDITAPVRKVKDWGVFGYGRISGAAAVASSFRLNKSNKIEQLYKVVVHELGHTRGLRHCSDPICIMADAKGKNNLDKGEKFCTNCAKHLRLKGWKL